MLNGEDIGENVGLGETLDETLKSLRGKGSISNFSNKVIYAILDNIDHAQPLASLMRSVPPNTVFKAFIDGVVDVEGYQVLKQHETSDSIFNGTSFILEPTSEKVESMIRFKEVLYGVYRDFLKSGSFQHTYSNQYSSAMYDWWLAAKTYSNGDIT